MQAFTRVDPVTKMQQSKRYGCRHDGCRSDATCIPRLYVPAHTMSINAAAAPVTSLMSLPLCDVHFKLLHVKQLLESSEIRSAIELEFRKRNAAPDFAKASIGRINDTDLDFGRFEVMQERARAS
jgi:hypothetical protein